jgi:hypothetical protein
MRTIFAALLLAACAFPASAAPEEPKTDYRVYLLARDPVNPIAQPNRADPIHGIYGDMRGELERLGAKEEKSGSFETPTPEGGTRGNDVVVYRASWTKAEYAKAAALGRAVDLLQLRIEPAEKPGAKASRGAAAPSSAAEIASARVQKQIGIALPPALLRGDGLPFDGSTARDSIADDYSRAAARLGVPLRTLPSDPAELARLLHASPAPPRPPQTFVPSPTASPLQYDSLIERAAAESGVAPDVLRGLLFASNGYSGGFARGTGLHGPMGLSLATARDYGLTRQTIDDPAANIDAAARYFAALKRMFGGNLSRSAAAYYCGSGAVRRSGGIPPDCAGYVSQFYLAYQNGAAWAINHNAPRQVRPVEPQQAVTPVEATVDQARESVVAAVHGDTPPNCEWHSKKTPPELIARVEAAAADNPFDARAKLDPAIFLGLVWAEGGYSRENKTPNAWGAVGPTQVTYSGAEPHCSQLDAKGRKVYDWKSIAQWNNRKNVDCGAKVFYDRIQWTSGHDPIIGLALYNTKAEHWPRIIARNKVPPFQETVSYVVRAAHVACARTGKMILTQGHFENAAALKIARREERRLVRDEFPYEGNAVAPDCRIFR